VSIVTILFFVVNL